jgi:7SK snRNA methylphosphate capping enzyme
MFGPLPIPPTPTGGTETGIALDAGVSENAFPHNVSFRRADWVNERIPEDEPGYDVILACALPTRLPSEKKNKTHD